MADVFISYKSEDRPRVQPLVEALQADGLVVWWDAQIEAGDGWRQRIQTELEAAKCVLVAWSRLSVGPQGEFVHDEATRAKRRGVYLPVLLDAVDLPLGFGEKQALSLVGWKGDRADPRYQSVLAAAQAVVSGKPAARSGGVAAAGVTGPALGRRAVIGGGAVLGAAALGGAGWFLLRPGAAEAAAESIAVLPFANLSGDPAQAYLADGLAEELRSALARIAGLKVAGRTSSELVRDADVKEAAEKLGVAHVLTGSVRKGGGTIRVNAQLLNGETGLEEWSERYDRPEGDALLVQTEIAESVANALSLSLGKAAAMLGGTRNPVAYDAYLRALAITGFGPEATRARLAAFDAALAADPDFAAAHALRALPLLILGNEEKTIEGRDRYFQLAEAAAQRAIALEPRLPVAHAALADQRAYALDLRGADAAFEKALALPGIDTRTLATAAQFYAILGRRDEALALADRAISLDPLNPGPQRSRIGVLRYNRQYDAALAGIAAYTAAHPDTPYPGGLHSLVLIRSGDPKGALAALESDTQEWRRLTIGAIAHAMLGNRAESDRALARLKADYGEVSVYQIAQVHAVRGEAEEAFAALERALETRDAGLADLRVDPEFDPLRKDPRYAAIEKRVGFPPA